MSDSAGDTSSEVTPRFKRILLKLSGEALIGDQSYGICTATIDAVAREILDVRNLGVDVAIVIGGGNIFRGVSASAKGMDRARADYMGMLATCINGLALQDALERVGVMTRVQSAITMNKVAEPYTRRRALSHLEKGRVVIFVAGTGNPYFTTDTAASLRAMEINADAILKATKVQGVYDRDPELDADAKLYRRLTYLQVLKDELRVMDATAIALCKENNLPILVFKLREPGNIVRAVLGENVGTLVTAE